MSEFKEIVVKCLGRVLCENLFVCYQSDLGAVTGYIFDSGLIERSFLSAISFENLAKPLSPELGDCEYPIGWGFSTISAVAMYTFKVEKRKSAKRILVADPLPSPISLEQIKRDLGGNVIFIYATDVDYEDAEKAFSKITNLAKDENCDVIVGNFPGCLAAEIVYSYERSERWNSAWQFFCQNNHAPLEKRWQRIA